MENINLGQISVALLFIYALIDVIDKLHNKFKNPLKTIIKQEIEPLKIQMTKDRIDNLKNFIVKCLDDLEIGEDLGETTKERLGEALDTYSNELKQNSYIHKRVVKLEKEGKL